MESNAPKKFPVLALVVGIVVAVVVFAVVSGAGLKGGKSRADVSRSKNSRSQDGGWARRSMGEVSIELPCELGPTENFLPQMPQALRGAVEYFEMFQGKRDDGLMAVVSRLSYKSGIPVDFDGAVKGAIANAAAKLGDKNPNYTANKMTINGLESRRVSYQKRFSGTDVQLEAVFVRDGQKLWQVIGIATGPSKQGDLDRMLKAVAVAP